MNKIAISLFFVTVLSYGMEEEGLYLVIGSTRNSVVKTTFPTQQLWQEEEADLSHIKTYGGKAITMDIKKSVISGAKHIIGDASVYQFGKNEVKAAYFERLPTINMYKINVEEENYLGNCIKNVGKAMEKEAKIEIEWHPCLFLVPEKNINEINTMYNEDFNQRNPFTAGLFIRLVILAFELACRDSLECNPAQFYSSQFIDCASKFSKKIKEMICFYEKENMGTKALLNNRLDEEVKLFKHLICTEEKVLLASGPTASLEKFSKAIASFLSIDTHDSSKVGVFCSFKQDNELFSGILYDKNLFLSESFLNFVLSDVAVEHNSAYVKEFMKDNGFKDISIERTTSLRNGRKNVWIVKGTKA